MACVQYMNKSMECINFYLNKFTSVHGMGIQTVDNTLEISRTDHEKRKMKYFGNKSKSLPSTNNSTNRKIKKLLVQF